jgi:DNA-binding IclR family transcriptional regulator
MSTAWGSTGRAILAHLPDHKVFEIYTNAGPSQVTGESLPPYPQFRAELGQIRERGYVRTIGQKVAGAVGISSAVLGPGGKVVGSLCLTFPKFRFDPSREAILGALLSEKAAALSRAGGYTGNRF